MPRFLQRDYRVGIPGGNAPPLQNVEQAGQLGRIVSGGVSNIAGDIGDYAFRSAQVDAHLARLNRQQSLSQSLAEANLDIASVKLEAMNSPDPTQAESAYAKGVEALRQKWKPDPGNVNEFNQRTELLARAAGLDVRAASLRERGKSAEGRLGLTLDTLSRAGGVASSDAERQDNVRQAQQAISVAVDGGVIRADQGEAELQKYKATLDNVTFKRKVMENPDQALQDIRDPSKYPNLSADHRVALTDYADRSAEADRRQREADVARQAAVEKAQTSETNAWGAVDLERKIKAGGAGLKDIETARAEGRITPSQYDSLATTFDTYNRAAIKQAQDDTQVADAIAQVGGAMGPGGPILNPKDKGDRDKVDAYFTSKAQGLQPNELQDLALTVSQKTGIIPPTLVGQLNGAIRGSPDRRAWAADLFAQLDRSNPQATDELPEDFKRGARLMGQYTSAGNSPKDSAALVDRDMQVTDAVRTAREKQLTEGGKTSPAALAWGKFTGSGKYSARADQPFFQAGDQGLSDPELSLPVKTAYEQEFRSAYVATGNYDAARAEADANIRKRWGVTQADGTRRWMQYAPEMVYGGGDWLGKQLVEQAAATSGVQADKLPGTLTLISDPLTSRAASAGQPITYGVMHIDPDSGLPGPVLAADGSAFRFEPKPPTAEDVRAKNLAAARAAKPEVQRTLEGMGVPSTEQPAVSPEVLQDPSGFDFKINRDANGRATSIRVVRRRKN